MSNTQAATARVIAPEGHLVAYGLSFAACQRIAFELGDGYTVETYSGYPDAGLPYPYPTTARGFVEMNLLHEAHDRAIRGF